MSTVDTLHYTTLHYRTFNFNQYNTHTHTIQQKHRVQHTHHAMVKMVKIRDTSCLRKKIKNK
jgi:hypothetical protein